MSTPTLSTPTVTTTPKTWSAILFDLDGTITDSAPGITTSLARTFEALGKPVPHAEELQAYVGPPLLESFQLRAGLSESEAWEAMRIYRADYADTAFDTAVYPGVAGLLERIHAEGVPLALATSKPEGIARRILESFNLDGYFTVICGATDDEKRSAKADVVEEALRRLQEKGVDVSRAVMIGDRSYDTIGAAAHGVPTILVEWGYGSPAEAADAYATVYSTDQLAKKLLG